MKKRILILGASGTAGTAIYRQLSIEKTGKFGGHIVPQYKMTPPP